MLTTFLFIEKSAFDFNYADIERIDVMRGPQGTLYGRNTMGGLIRVFTKSPFTYQGTDLRLSGATYNDYQASLTHYHRISNQFAFSVGHRFTAMTEASLKIPITQNALTGTMNSADVSGRFTCLKKT